MSKMRINKAHYPDQYVRQTVQYRDGAETTVNSATFSRTVAYTRWFNDAQTLK